MSHGANGLVIREINVNLVRDALKAKREATKAEVAQQTGLSLVTVAHALQELIDSGEALEVGSVASTGGRRALNYKFNENHSHVLVLFTNEEERSDIVHIRAANLYGDCVYRADERLMNITVETFEPYVKQALSEVPSIRAIGFGLPGFEFGGKVVIQDYKNLIGTRFSEHYRLLTGLPVIYENDVNATLHGYCTRMGHSAELATVYLYFPERYPPGAAVHLNGSLYRGFSGYAGEISYMPYGIDWLAPSLYRAFEPCCEAVAKMTISACCMLNPNLILLHGPFLTQNHLQKIRQKCAALLPDAAIPEILLKEDFMEDYQYGVINETLALLDKHPTILE